MASPDVRTKHRIVAELEAEFLKRIRQHGGLSRADLARQLSLAPSTSTIYVDRLKQDGFLLESERIDRRAGRWPTLLTPNPRAGHFLGIDFEAHSLVTIVVDFALGAISRTRSAVAPGESVEKILARMKEAIQKATRAGESPLLGVGVGVPGVIDAARGTASYYEFVAGWKNVPIASVLREACDVPVYLENNIRSMALAEFWLGQGRGLQNFVCLGVRTGIGLGVVVNGELLRGSQGGAGELGNWPVPGAQPTAGPGPDENLESISSLSAILDEAAKILGKKVDFDGFLAAVRAGNPRLLEVIERAAAVHGAAIRQVHLLLEPERIIVAGPLSELGGTFLTPLTIHVGRRFAGAAPVIVASDFGRFGGALGAAALAAHHWKPKRE